MWSGYIQLSIKFHFGIILFFQWLWSLNPHHEAPYLYTLQEYMNRKTFCFSCQLTKETGKSAERGKSTQFNVKDMFDLILVKVIITVCDAMGVLGE